jgi:hypothetical protein
MLCTQKFNSCVSRSLTRLMRRLDEFRSHLMCSHEPSGATEKPLEQAVLLFPDLHRLESQFCIQGIWVVISDNLIEIGRCGILGWCRKPVKYSDFRVSTLGQMVGRGSAKRTTADDDYRWILHAVRGALGLAQADGDESFEGSTQRFIPGSISADPELVERQVEI